MEAVDVLILGAGIAGMGAAWKAREEGLTFAVVEAADRAGGVLETVHLDGHTLDLGANSAAASPLLDAFLDHLGLAEQKREARPVGKNRFLWQDTGVEAVKPSPFALLGAKWLTGRGKRALFFEPFRRRGPANDESVYDFLSRRIGAEAVERLVDPVLAGIYAGDVRRLSARAVLPKLKDGEQVHGSLLRTMLKNKPEKRVIHNVDGGFGRIGEAFERLFRGQLFLGSPVRTLEPTATGWRVVAGAHTFEAKKVVSALPAYALAEVAEAHFPRWAGELAELPYAPLQVTFVREPESDERLAGFGVLVPSHRGKWVKGVLMASEVFEGRAPAGERNLTVFHAPGSTYDVMAELEEMLGPAERKVLMTKNWARAIPQFELGYENWREKVLKNRPRNLELAGNYLGKVSVADSLKSGYDLNLRP